MVDVLWMEEPPPVCLIGVVDLGVGVPPAGM